MTTQETLRRMKTQLWKKCNGSQEPSAISHSILSSPEGSEPRAAVSSGMVPVGSCVQLYLKQEHDWETKLGNESFLLLRTGLLSFLPLGIPMPTSGEL